MPDLISVSEAARRAKVKPNRLSDWLYRGTVRGADRCTLIANRRLVPLDLLPAIRKTARKLDR